MRIIQGKSASEGIAFGTVWLYRRDELSDELRHIDDPDSEINRFSDAKKLATEQLDSLYVKALLEVGEDDAQIFDAHKMLMEDPDLNETVENIITEQLVNAEYAVSIAAEQFADMFAEMEDEYMRERSADVRDVADRLLRCLMSCPDTEREQCDGCVVCADDLSPSETMQIDRKLVLAFCTANGSAHSHAAILARNMGIPAVTGLGTELFDIKDGDEIIVDGGDGVLYINPDIATKKDMLKKRAAVISSRERLLQLRGRENITLDGRRVSVFANVANIEDMQAALANDCGGIGLFRSEFLYSGHTTMPTEEYQFRTYRAILERMGGKKIAIRTRDIGLEKLQREKMEKGFCRHESFKIQIRALMRASVYGRLGILFPMVISHNDIIEAKAVLAQVKSELDAEGVPYDRNTEIGIFIETPAAVMISDLLAKEVDFLTIGSNDLAVHTLAVDNMTEMFYTHHTALLRMIKMVAENAHKHGASVGICGGLGAETSLAEVFLAMGIDEFSVTPQKILPLREKIRSITLENVRSSLDSVMV